MIRALTFAAVLGLARLASAAPTPSPNDAVLEPGPPPPPPPEVVEATVQITDSELARLASRESLAEVVLISGGSARGVAEDFLVLPDGLDVGGRLRFVIADDGLGVGRIRATDLALFEASASWGLGHGLELDGTLAVLAKQPGATDEPVFQGGSLAIRRAIGHATAIALSGAAAPLAGVDGVALRPAAFAIHKHRLDDDVAFVLAAGTSATFLRPTMADGRPALLEVAGLASVQFRFNRYWGMWMGAGYALPVAHRGRDPIGGMALDPQPRLDLELGTAIQIGDRWDLTLEMMIVDRGDRTDPATRLPVLDGGFDQIQLGVGISRRIDLTDRSRRRPGVGDQVIRL